MEPKFNLIEDGEFSQMYTDFISSDALSLSQLLTIPTQDLVAENKGNYHMFGTANSQFTYARLIK